MGHSIEGRIGEVLAHLLLPDEPRLNHCTRGRQIDIVAYIRGRTVVLDHHNGGEIQHLIARKRTKAEPLPQILLFRDGPLLVDQVDSKSRCIL